MSSHATDLSVYAKSSSVFSPLWRLHVAFVCLSVDRMTQKKLSTNFRLNILVWLAIAIKILVMILFTIIIIIISGLHHYECVAPLVTNSLQSRQFCARPTASVNDSPWESRSFCTVFIQVIRDHPGGLFQYTEGEKVKICLASSVDHSGNMLEYG